MSTSKTITSRIKKEEYETLQRFLSVYNRRNGRNYTMSKLIWEVLKLYMTHSAKVWRKTPQNPM